MADEDKVYPRTGKRGVPQQFPRKLYEMLEFESGSLSVDWVANGRGFCITNVEHFSQVVLPKWFKVRLYKSNKYATSLYIHDVICMSFVYTQQTCKFSSFQRNLNLVSSL